MGGVDDVVGTGGQGVTPCEGGLGTGLDGDDGVGFGGGVGAAVADYVVAGYVVYGLRGSQMDMSCIRRAENLHRRMKERGRRLLLRRH